ncbi:acyl transferase domain protein [Mycobacterium xenopi 4042]|uniref:Acyl transferase domain protein n=1 Tax=Mycobacterium xenopi 4042 TaxID=1299334 RepID=X8AP20_MYCXE|nr:acyl transferase domain protein [Mycobacterium xenopi 4042]
MRFDRAVTAASERGVDAFVELSAHPSLLAALADLVDESAVIVGSGRRDEPIAGQLSANIAAMAVADRGYRWGDLAGVDDLPPLSGFPNAPMKAIHLWAKREPLPPVPGSVVTVAAERWQSRRTPRPSNVRRRRIAILKPAITDTPLPRRLADAVAAHQDCELAGVDDAEIVVAIAPLCSDMTCGPRRPRSPRAPTWCCPTTPAPSGEAAAVSGWSLSPASRSNRAIRSVCRRRRHWLPCTAVSGSSIPTTGSRIWTCRRLISTLTLRGPASTWCSATPSRWPCAAAAAMPERWSSVVIRFRSARSVRRRWTMW